MPPAFAQLTDAERLAIIAEQVDALCADQGQQCLIRFDHQCPPALTDAQRQQLQQVSAGLSTSAVDLEAAATLVDGVLAETSP